MIVQQLILGWNATRVVNMWLSTMLAYLQKLKRTKCTTGLQTQIVFTLLCMSIVDLMQSNRNIVIKFMYPV